MLLPEEDSDVFKLWLLPKLETISDADAEVLADYVIALVTANESEASIRSNCLESLADFLQDYTASFVEDVVKALKDKSYDRRASAKAKGAKPQSTLTRPQHTQASQAAPIPSIVGSLNSEYELHSLRFTNTPPLNAPKGPAAARAPKAQHHLPDQPTASVPRQPNSPSLNMQQDKVQTSRKRKLVEHERNEAQEGQDPHYTCLGTGNRPVKQTARRGEKTGGKNLRGAAADFEPQNAFTGFAPMPNILNMAKLPPPPGPVPFDMSSPMAFFAMMAALGTTMPDMLPLPAMNLQGSGTNGYAPKAKCQDYHNMGFCALGSMCQFEHGNTDHDVPEYDPDQPSLGTRSASNSKAQRGVNRTIHRGTKAGRHRAHFSLPGPSYDRTNTTLVIEQIPEKDFSEDNVRNFFSEFGTLVEVQMHAYKRLAIVRFEDHAGANQAYNSPKAVFENRFVKVYWHKQDKVAGVSKGDIGDVEMADGEAYNNTGEVLDPEEITKRQVEAQKVFEERRKKMEEAEARAAEIERQLKEKDEEMKKIKQQLAELAGEETNGAMEAKYSLDLATLQAEAEGLFAENDTLQPIGRGRGDPPRGVCRGIYQGRGYALFPLRGRGIPRGARRGRGAFATSFARPKSSVKRLDNRPRRLAVASIEKGTTKDEALRQYLVNVPECNSIEQHPDQANTLILNFQERYQAESFIDASCNIPDINTLELSWVPNNAFNSLKSTTTTNNTNDDAEAEASDDNSSTTMGGDEKAEVNEQQDDADADMDVAEDGDQWL